MRASTAKIDCPAAPPSRQTTYARALHRACLILGGVPQLASHLGVSEPPLRGWLEGRDDPPDGFLPGGWIRNVNLDGSAAAGMTFDQRVGPLMLLVNAQPNEIIFVFSHERAADGLANSAIGAGD